MQPLEQIYDFLEWFCQQGVSGFDIHLRVPKTRNEDYKTDQWIWLTHHEGITFYYIREKLIKWLRCQNVNSADIFFRPHKNGKHPVIFLDDVPTSKARLILKKYGYCVIETHPGNTQIWLKVDKSLNAEQRKQAQTILKHIGFTDPGSIAGNHLGRLCGFKSQKRTCWVNFIGRSDLKPWEPDIYPELSLPVRVFCASKKHVPFNKDTSDSGREFGWVLGMLRIGIQPEIAVSRLTHAAQKRGKQNAGKYAYYTI